MSKSAPNKSYTVGGDRKALAKPKTSLPSSTCLFPLLKIQHRSDSHVASSRFDFQTKSDHPG